MCKIGAFYLQLLEINDQDQEPSEKFGSQIQEQLGPAPKDQVVLTHDLILIFRTWSWSGSPKHTLRYCGSAGQ